MTSPLRLQYFNIRGKAELARLLLAAAGVQYEDERIANDAFKPLQDPTLPQWTELKADTHKFPFGQMPTAVVGDTVIPQSHAIERYIAREHGLMGSTSVEAALIDALNETILDQREKWLKAKTDDEKVAFIKNELPKQYSALENFAKTHGDGQHFVGSSLSYADIAFYYNHSRFNDSAEQTQLADEVLKSYASLHAIDQAVKANKGIATWVDSRPKTIW